MADNDQIVDLDTLTDEQVMNLSPEQIQGLMTQESKPDDTQPAPVVDVVIEPTVTSEPSASVAESVSVQTEVQTDPVVTDPNQIQEKPSVAVPTAKPDAVQEKPKTSVTEPVATEADSIAALDFFKKVSTPFKADGKDIQVRTPEDVIRLMQMGVNYSRRMQEMKPLRAMDNMLKAHGLNDPEKLNFLIDLSKGKPEAIQKLLKEKKIDPIDLDVSKDTGYKATNYQADPKDVAFQEAIDNTISTEVGKSLIKDINATWDKESKEFLREEPSTFQNLLEQKQTGVYGKIKTELDYQRTMGYLTDVPFIQAYHQVGAAMQKAGVFGSPKPTELKLQSVVTAEVPIDTGTRKAAPPKTELPNPNLSSTNQPRVVPPNGGNQNEPDYFAMSDADFMKLAPPR